MYFDDHQARKDDANPKPAGVVPLSSLQVLRAVAALAVVIFHISTTEKFADIGSFSILNAGVDVFFVVSGFVMVHARTGRPVRLGRFLVDRFIRIAPLYWIAMAIMLLVLAMRGLRVPTLGEIALAYAFIPYINPESGLPAPFLNVGWTLSYEVFFYVMFGCTMFLRPRLQLVVLALLFGLLAAMRPTWGDDGAIGLRVTSPLLFEFLFGAALRMFWPKSFENSWRRGLLLVIAGVVSMVAASIWLPFMPRAFVKGIPAAAFVAGFVMMEFKMRGPLTAPLRLMGDASYSIYLFHVPTMIVVLPFLEPLPILPFSLTLLVIMVGAGIVLHMLVERPVVTKLRLASRYWLSGGTDGSIQQREMISGSGSEQRFRR